MDFKCLYCSSTTRGKLRIGFAGHLPVSLELTFMFNRLFFFFFLPLDSKKQSYNLQVMQHLPVPATGAAHSLDSWYHRGSPPSLHARVRFWPAKWGRSQNAAVDFHFPHHFILSEFRRKMDSCSEHYALWTLIILDYFYHLYLRTLQFFLDVFCMDLVKERMLCTFCTASASC